MRKRKSVEYYVPFKRHYSEYEDQTHFQVKCMKIA